MKFIRWPIVSLLLFALLIGFFMTGYLSNSKIKNDFEYYSSDALNTIVKVGKLDLNIYHSYLRMENIIIIDPGNKSRFAFSAKSIDLKADVSKFFEKRIVLREARIHNGALILRQTKKGRFAFLSKRAYQMSEYEPTIIKINKILTWTADHLNPIKIFSPGNNQILNEATNTNYNFDIKTLKNNSSTQIVVRGYELKLPNDYPDFLAKLISFANCNIDLYPFGRDKPLKLRNVSGKIFELSSRPQKHPKPVTFLANGFVGNNPHSWFNIAARTDVYSGRTNIVIDFAVSNVFLPDILSIANVYTSYARMLDIENGYFTARGHFEIKNGKIVPSSVYCRLDNFTAQAIGETTGQKWLNSLSISNAFLEAVIPVNDKKPYFHFETAFEQDNINTKIHNLKIKIKPSDLGGDMFNDIF